MDISKLSVVLSDQIKESGKSKSWDGSSRNDILMLYAQLWVEKINTKYMVLK